MLGLLWLMYGLWMVYAWFIMVDGWLMYGLWMVYRRRGV
jgi:hypothetical protein